MVETNLYVKPGQLRPLGLDQTRQRTVLNFVRGLQKLEHKLFQSLHIYYYARGRVEICHNAALILSRILSARFNLPVSQTLPPERDHIQIVIGIYAPADQRQACYQTFLKVYLAGQTFYIDPTFERLFRGGQGILFRHYPPERFNQELSREFHLDPFHPDHPANGRGNVLLFDGTTSVERLALVEAALRVLHNPKLVDDEINVLVGFTVDEWNTADRAIRFVEPRGALPDLITVIKEALPRLSRLQLLLLAPIDDSED